jgi:hypothetical protein
MRNIEALTADQRRHLVHIYASLRECIPDEVEYDRAPDFPPLDEETEVVVWQEIYNQITRLMVAAHAEEAAILQAESEAYSAAYQAQRQAGEAEADAK